MNEILLKDTYKSLFIFPEEKKLHSGTRGTYKAVLSVQKFRRKPA